MAKLTKGMKWSDFSSKPHWTQTPAGRRKMSRIQHKVRKAAKHDTFHEIIKTATRMKRTSKQTSNQTSLIVNGWRITLSKDEIRIDHE